MLKDISAMGACIMANLPFGINDYVVIKAQLPFLHNRIEKRAKVAWCNRLEPDLWSAGLEFDLGERLDIRSLVEESQKKAL